MAGPWVRERERTCRLADLDRHFFTAPNYYFSPPTKRVQPFARLSHAYPFCFLLFYFILFFLFSFLLFLFFPSFFSLRHNFLFDATRLHRLSRNFVTSKPRESSRAPPETSDFASDAWAKVRRVALHRRFFTTACGFSELL